MQLNGTEGIIMAASEAPEPPPRNPDKINASLKQTSETVTPTFNQIVICLHSQHILCRNSRLHAQKSSKSLDVCDRQATNSVNNGKTLQPILSLDGSLLAKTPAIGAKPNDVTATPSPTTVTANETTTTLTPESVATPATDSNCNSPKTDEANGKLGSSKSSSSSISTASASKTDAENGGAARSSDLISNNRNDNDTGTASDVNNKQHESNDTERAAVSVSGE